MQRSGLASPSYTASKRLKGSLITYSTVLKHLRACRRMLSCGNSKLLPKRRFVRLICSSRLIGISRWASFGCTPKLLHRASWVQAALTHSIREHVSYHLLRHKYSTNASPVFIFWAGENVMSLPHHILQ